MQLALRLVDLGPAGLEESELKLVLDGRRLRPDDPSTPEPADWYSPEELDAMTGWVVEHLGPDVPMHFTAFHPDWKMRDRPPTPAGTLRHARAIGLANGLRYVYTGNVHDFDGSSTYCPDCGGIVIGRDWYQLSNRHLEPGGRCGHCGATIAGVFDPAPSAH